ncbi:hypothetical protein, partial [Klebsiella pneumoniae]|uniref:hypothetical protein n=1 Tax=Klebsiella pneumoniae TaxID=573 RepID=UPI001C9E20F9
MENWLTSSVKARESALILRRYGVHGALLEFLCRNWCSYKLKTIPINIELDKVIDAVSICDGIILSGG